MPFQQPIYVCPHCKTKIPFGTVTEPPARQCPNCHFRLYIPTVLKNLPWIEITCPYCSADVTVEREWTGWWHACPKCGAILNVPDEPPSAPD